VWYGAGSTRDRSWSKKVHLFSAIRGFLGRPAATSSLGELLFAGSKRLDGRAAQPTTKTRRMRRALCISNGLGPGVGTIDGNNRKDFFGRVGYRFGGLSLDGEEYEPSEKNWREKSVRVGAVRLSR
jgi:hypothetical protein